MTLILPQRKFQEEAVSYLQLQSDHGGSSHFHSQSPDKHSILKTTLQGNKSFSH